METVILSKPSSTAVVVDEGVFNLPRFRDSFEYNVLIDLSLSDPNLRFYQLYYRGCLVCSCVNLDNLLIFVSGISYSTAFE